MPEEEGVLEPLPSAEAEALGRAGQLDLLRRVHDLPEPGREVVYLRVFSSLSFRDRGGAGTNRDLGPGDLLPLQGASENRR